MTAPNVQFDFIASTGRTATTFLASALNTVDGVLACHEGYLGAEKENNPALPLVNLENGQIFRNPDCGPEIVAAKRGPDVFTDIAKASGTAHIIDVAYYNATLALPLLRYMPSARMIGIIRDSGEFVRSSTTLEGEDLLPVGWPAIDKPLTQREQFIAMGRIKPPRKSEAGQAWRTWDALQRNIWLWEATNTLLIEAQEEFPDRVRLMRFETFRSQPDVFWKCVQKFFDLPIAADMASAGRKDKINRKSTGYQIGPPTEWPQLAQDALQASQDRINERVNYEC